MDAKQEKREEKRQEEMAAMRKDLEKKNVDMDLLKKEYL